jgi:ABC-type nitrate/sulfonate/bicarbonate transport system permease component
MKSFRTIAGINQILFPSLFICFLIIGWEIYTSISGIEEWLLPAPSAIMAELFESRELLLNHGLQTILEALLGFLLALILAALLAVVIDLNILIKRTIYPLLVLSQTVPIIAVAPLIGIWLGLGLLPKVIIVALVCFFPIVISLADGLQQTDREMIRVLQSMGANRWQMYRYVKIPSALPSLFSGLRIAGTYCVMGAVIAEWLGAERGLGIMLTRASKSFLTDRVFATIFVISILSIIIYFVIELLARKLLAWQAVKELDN